MEKRLALAFALSFLVLILWSFFSGTRQDDTDGGAGPQNEITDPELRKFEGITPPPAINVGKGEGAQNSFEGTDTGTSSAEDNRDEGKSTGSPPAIAEKDIIVDTPLYEAVFTNRGATIKSFKLKNYRTDLDPDSPMVDLVNSKEDHDFFSVAFTPLGAVYELEGKTAEDAIEKASRELNVSEEQIDVRVIEPGSSVLFGLLGSEPAKFSVSVKQNEVLYSASKDSINVSEGSGPVDLTFTSSETNGVSIDQTFRFYPDKYTINLYVTLTDISNEPINGEISTTLNNLLPEGNRGYASFTGTALLFSDKLQQIKFTKMKKEGQSLSGEIGWVAYESGYFMSSIIPEEQGSGDFYGLTRSSGILSAVYSQELNSSAGKTFEYSLYFGPKDQDILKGVGKRLEKAIYYGWFDIIAKPLHFLLRLFYKFVHNYGVSIIILTILIRVLFWPLTHKSYTSMKEMQKIQPLMARIREKYKDDREQMQREMMALYKTYKVNPMGGCLPMLIQIPVFFALYRILGSSIELRHEPFMLWINDLSAPDRLFNFPFNIPYMVDPDGIPVLTLLMGASMFLQQKMSPPPGDPAQAKMMMFLPIVFTLMFINFQSGLVLYWLVNNLIGIGQQYRIRRSSV